MKGICCFTSATLALAVAGCATTNAIPATSVSTNMPVLTLPSDEVQKTNTLSSGGGVAKRPPPPKNTTVVDGDYVIISVYIDAVTERLKGDRLEGTGMLRTNWRLRQMFPDLPKRYSLPSRLRFRRLDRKTGIYTVVTEFRVSSIQAILEKETKVLESSRESGRSQDDGDSTR